METVYLKRIRSVLAEMPAGAALLLYSGDEVPSSLDACHPFYVNSNFFYLTGLQRANMALFLLKPADARLPLHVNLFIEEPLPLKERWTGRRMTVEECREVSGIADVRYIDALPAFLARCVERERIEEIFCDCYRCRIGDPDSYNMTKAKEFAALYPAIRLRDAHKMIAAHRMVKDEEELTRIRRAIGMTDKGLRRVLSRLEPGMKEYQAQADFEYRISDLGADGVAFPTIAGSGLNGCMLHYDTNRMTLEPDTLLLLDLGAKADGYCSDITRTYPVSGHYTARQRQIYEIVLKANREVAAKAAPGMTLLQLNEICKNVLAEGLIGIGLIKDASELGRYYMHSVSHHLGIDTHDAVTDDRALLKPGCVITDEPGLYIDEEAIGIRIEDDLLITENGCEVLSEALPRNPEEIEALMAARKE